MNNISIEQSSTIDRFWHVVDITKTAERYRIDKNLQTLKTAPLDTLKKIFIQYRFFTHYYITDLAILISKLPLGQLRSILAEILYDELGKGQGHLSHPELYDDFLRSLGIQHKELNYADETCLKNLANIQHSLITKSWTYGLGLRGMGGECLCQIYLSTMYDFFSKNPVILERQHQIAWKFWEIHIGEIDLHHQQIIRDAINDLILSQPTSVQDLTNGYLESKGLWEQFWERIFKIAKNHSGEYTYYASINT